MKAIEMKSVNTNLANASGRKSELIKYIDSLMNDDELGQLEKNLLETIVSVLLSIEPSKDKAYHVPIKAIPQLMEDSHLRRFTINVLYEKSWEFKYLPGINEEYMISPPKI